MEKSIEKRYFGTDGIRGQVGKGVITPSFIMKLGWAVGRVLAGNHGGDKVVIGKDTRTSGYMFESALEAGLSAAGLDILLFGPMPTPAVAYLTRTLHAQAGIVISASHNPYQDNGIKFFSAEGTKLSDETELAIEAEIDKEMGCVDSARLGKAERVVDAAGRYIEFCKSTVPLGLSLKGLKVVVDCAHGATYHIAPYVYEELGATVIAIGTDPDGININEGCGSTHPSLLQKTVLENNADVGIALDGDGDRILMVDHKGELVDGDELLFIIAQSRLSQSEGVSVVVGTSMSNLGLEQSLNKLGIDFKRAKVGDRYVMEILKQGNWKLGGESSGHIICLDKTTTGDGVISSLQILYEIFHTDKSLHELKSGMTKFPQCLVNVKLAGEIDLNQNKDIDAAVKSAEEQLQTRGRVLLRPSGTEPLVRVMVEGEEYKEVELIANTIAEVVKNSVIIQ
jgi:phosphoglucosamine mutase